MDCPLFPNEENYILSPDFPGFPTEYVYGFFEATTGPAGPARREKLKEISELLTD